MVKRAMRMPVALENNNSLNKDVSADQFIVAPNVEVFRLLRHGVYIPVAKTDAQRCPAT